MQFVDGLNFEHETSALLNGQTLHAAQLDDRQPVVGANFAQHTVDVVAHRLLGKLQLAGDLFIS